MDKRFQAITVRTVFVVAILMHLRVPVAADGVKVSTFSIVAVDPQTGECGAAVASKYPAVGKVVPYVQADVGAFCTQHYHVPAWGPMALEQLAMGKPVEVIIAELLRQDRHPGQRQLSIIDMQGNTAVHHPTDAVKGSQYWGAMTGRFYACQGNTLAGSEVITQMAKAYERAEGSLLIGWSPRYWRVIERAETIEGDLLREFALPKKAKLAYGSNWMSMKAMTPSMSWSKII